jgi:hypothetical protein
VSKAKSQQLHITWGEVVVVVAVSERVSETCWLTQRVLVLFACAKAKQRLSLREREKKTKCRWRCLDSEQTHGFGLMLMVWMISLGELIRVTCVQESIHPPSVLYHILYSRENPA